MRFSAQRANFTNRTSYVIAPNGRIIYAYSDLDWRNHVTNTLRGGARMAGAAAPPPALSRGAA